MDRRGFFYLLWKLVGVSVSIGLLPPKLVTRYAVSTFGGPVTVILPHPSEGVGRVFIVRHIGGGHPITVRQGQK